MKRSVHLMKPVRSRLAASQYLRKGHNLLMQRWFAVGGKRQRELTFAPGLCEVSLLKAQPAEYLMRLIPVGRMCSSLRPFSLVEPPA